VADWDTQIEFGLNTSLNCSSFLEFVFLSRERIKIQLGYVRGNFSAQDAQARADGEDGIATALVMSHMSSAASLVSAQTHIHGVLAAARRECLSEHLQLLFLMSLSRLKSLLNEQLRHMWVVFQGTPELLRQGCGTWLAEVADLLEADLRTFASVMQAWQPPAEECSAAEGDDACPAGAAPAGRPGPPLPVYSEREPDGIALSTFEVLRRDTFEDWPSRKPVLRALLRYVLPRGSHVADFCGRSGQVSRFLNDTGLVNAYAFDPSPNIRTLTKGSVDYARLHAVPLGPFWRTFDVILCLSAASDFGQDGDVWASVWQNLQAHASGGAVLACGSGSAREQALASASAHAPQLEYEELLSQQLGQAIRESTFAHEAASADEDGICIFRRRAGTR